MTVLNCTVLIDVFSPFSFLKPLNSLNDYAFWIDEPKFNTTKKRCKLISDAMAHQASIVRSTAGRENDEMVTYLWSEMLDLYLSGDLVIPQNSCTVFADAGGSGKFDPRIYDKLKPGDGVSDRHMSKTFNSASPMLIIPPSTTTNSSIAGLLSCTDGVARKHGANDRNGTA